MGLKEFDKLSDIPEFPRYANASEYKLLIEEFINAGAIPRKDLIIGEWYTGQSRSTGIAQWVGNKFQFIRNKLGGSYIDTINHFEDDNDHDLFIPFKLIETI